MDLLKVTEKASVKKDPAVNINLLKQFASTQKEKKGFQKKKENLDTNKLR
jgi:hypothetical protein